MSLKLAVIIGSTRPTRRGPAVAEWVADLARSHGDFEVELVDLAELNLPFLDEPEHPAKQAYVHDHTKRWSAIVAAADAFVFVTPEYDYFVPATLVNAVQTLLREWNYKVAGVVSYGGISGGLRAAQELRQLLSNVGVMPLQGTVPLPLFGQYFDDDDGSFEPGEKSVQGLTQLFGELLKWGPALKTIRG